MECMCTKRSELRKGGAADVWLVALQGHFDDCKQSGVGVAEAILLGCMWDAAKERGALQGDL